MSIFLGIALAVHVIMFLNAVANAVKIRGSSWSVSSFSGELPPVSVLVPARNEEQNLPRLIRSFEIQDHPRAELIIYDDLSEDGTWDVIESFESSRISGVRGGPVPDGWMGKVNGCYQLSLLAKGDVWLFLDADTEFQHPAALRHMCTRFEERPTGTILTGMTLLKGQGQLIVTLVGSMILAAMPWWLGRRVPHHMLTGVNGQCWMTTREEYRRFEPHQHVKGEVLEDIMIGRYLHRQGIVPLLDDVRDEVKVYMYPSFAGAWQGFRKNTAHMLGKSWLTSMLGLVLFTSIMVVAPILNPWLFVPIYLTKIVTDRTTRQTWLITLLAPISYLVNVFLALDSIFSRASGKTIWKGRKV